MYSSNYTLIIQMGNKKCQDDDSIKLFYKSWLWLYVSYKCRRMVHATRPFGGINLCEMDVATMVWGQLPIPLKEMLTQVSSSQCNRYVCDALSISSNKQYTIFLDSQNVDRLKTHILPCLTLRSGEAIMLNDSLFLCKHHFMMISGGRRGDSKESVSMLNHWVWSAHWQDATMYVANVRHFDINLHNVNGLW